MFRFNKEFLGVATVCKVLTNYSQRGFPESAQLRVRKPFKVEHLKKHPRSFFEIELDEAKLQCSLKPFLGKTIKEAFLSLKKTQHNLGFKNLIQLSKREKLKKSFPEIELEETNYGLFSKSQLTKERKNPMWACS